MKVSAEIFSNFDVEAGRNNICRTVTCSKPAVMSLPCKLDILEGIHARLYLCAECGGKIFNEFFPFPLPSYNKAETQGQASL